MAGVSHASGLSWPKNPTLYEINTWPWLDQLSQATGRRVTLDSVPQTELDRIAALGFDGVWLMGVWQRSAVGRRLAREHPGVRAECRRALPDCGDEDVTGSPFAIAAYRVDPALGGDVALAALRRRLADLGMRLMLDFVPNHLARDHLWVAEHPEWLVQREPAALSREPQNFFDVAEAGRRRIFAHGRDPHFCGWSDTVQVDYRSAAARRAMADILLSIAERCDGARCDMAMLVTRDVFLRTWGGAFEPPRADFWPAVATDLYARQPGFLLLAEVYWDLEWELLQQGFSYAYDKRLYDRLLANDIAGVHLHLTAGADHAQRLARFTENHDEQRATVAFGVERSLAAAALAYTLPGLRLFHDGQIDGWQVKLPVQLGRRAAEPAHPAVAAFFRRLLAALRHPVFHDGNWYMSLPTTTAAGNSNSCNLLAYRWSLGDEHRLVTVNLSPERAQVLVPVDLPTLAGRACRLEDLLNGTSYVRQGDDMLDGGLHVDLPGYGFHLFELHSA
ncbi:MAG: alpha-amylase family glycosyl hydrolase [Candidatus Bipolaricaulota bacterium]